MYINFKAWSSAYRYNQCEQQEFFALDTLLPQLPRSSPPPSLFRLQHPSTPKRKNRSINKKLEKIETQI